MRSMLFTALASRDSPSMLQPHKPEAPQCSKVGLQKNQVAVHTEVLCILHRVAAVEKIRSSPFIDRGLVDG